MDKNLVVNQIIEGIESAASKATTELEKDQILSERELFEELDIKSELDFIQMGALATLSLNGRKAKYFVSPTGSGTMMKVKDNVIIVLSVFSPLGNAILDARVGDKISVIVAGNPREYTVEEIL